MDRGVALVLLTRLIPLLAAPLTLWLVATRRPVAEQGLYFIFWNFQAVALLMELNIGGLMVQFASHESPLLNWDARGGLTGDESARLRIHALLHEGRRWYRRIALVVLVVGGAGGTWLLHSRGSGVSPAPLLPWLVTVLCTAAYLPLVPALCTIEGCGGLVRVQRMRLAQVAISMAALWSVLPRWGALWAVATFSVVWLGVAWSWLARAHSGLLAESRDAEVDTTDEAAGRLAPLQWRTGASWIATWVAPQALTPIVLATHGPAAAGQIGMSLAIASAPLTLAAAWLQGRYPRYGALIARGATDELRRVARTATMQAVGVFLVGMSGATMVVWLLGQFAPALAARALPPLGIAILGAGNLGWLLLQSLGSYLRAWREEPLMEMALAGAAGVMVGTLLVARHASSLGTVAAYALLVVALALPLGLYGFHRHHRRRPA